MRDNINVFHLNRMSKVLKVSRSGYYAWIRRPISAREKYNLYLSERIKSIYEERKRVYGCLRITAELRDEGFSCSKNRVARLMRKQGITARTKKRFRVTTNSKHNLPIAPNLVDMQFNPEKANSLWTSDITYIRTREGWLYLSIVLDLWSRSVISWRADRNMDENLVIKPIERAIRDRRPDGELILHSDRGSQYASQRLRQILKENNITQSMCSKGNCYDNAPTESFFSTLKRELIYRERYRTTEEAKQSLFEYIEVFYNRQRRHSTLGYLSPLEFEKRNINLLNHS
jgi:transposase InsO family protein